MPEVAAPSVAFERILPPRDRERVDLYLAAFLARSRRKHAANPHIRPLFDQLVEFVLRGGKRLRPRLALASFRILANTTESPARSVWLAASSLELFHAFMLVHDDLIDSSLIRRGEPTLHEALRMAGCSDRGSLLSRKSAADLGLVAGDLLFALGMRLIGRAGLEPATLARSQRLLSDMLLETGLGEALDVLYNECPLDALEESHLYDAYIRKTARYTVSGPLVLGAILAGASADIVRGLRRFGDLLGLSYQLQNDLDGLNAEDHQECPDLDGGKRTWIVWKAYQLHAEAGRVALVHALEMPSGAERRAILQNLIADSGAIGECRSRLHAIRREAEATLRDGTLQPGQRRALMDLATLFQPPGQGTDGLILDGALIGPA